MFARLIRIILALAVMFMPIGMATATASPAHSAANAGHSLQVTDTGMGHCDQSSGTARGLGADCNMACASALPVAPQVQSLAPSPLTSGPELPAKSARLSELVPDIVVPPPKLL